MIGYSIMASKSAKYKSEMMSPCDLIPYENNPRINEQAIEQLIVNIEEFGFTDPIIVDKDMVILAGHTRREAAIRLGMKEVPVHIMTNISTAKGKAFRLAHNKAGEIAGWDFDKLSIELDDLRDMYDMEIFGFDMSSDIDGLFADDFGGEIDTPQPVPEEVSEPNSAVIVEVDSDDDAHDLIERLSSEGYVCRMI
jgi:hypothetical protein